MKIALWCGEPVENFTKTELLEALNDMTEYYEKRIKGLRDIIDLEGEK